MKIEILKRKVGAIAVALTTLLLSPSLPSAGEISEIAGAPKPELSLPDLQGQQQDLKAFRGRVLLVNFWASWCTPCIEEMPSIQHLADQMRDKPFTVLGINVEESRFRAMTIVQRLKLGFPVLLDADGAVFKRWGATVLPTTYVLDPEGVVRYVGRGPIEWDAADTVTAIEALLGPSPKASTADESPAQPLGAGH